ncbi:MAG TPA: class I SAM-dependent methyltransferase [Thermoleophilia bacterium]|nr:class I SAM-dependent methyltransferase [Thermoleophilia bacterium]
MKERLYDLLNKGLDRSGFGQRRDRLVGPLEGDVLEVGAGTGLNVPRYLHARRLVVVEPNRTYRRRLQARAREACLPVEVLAGTAEALPFPDESFDNVVTSIALCSVTDLDAALGEIRRVLRPGGTLHFLEHVRGEERLGRWQDSFTPLQRRLADNCHLNRDTTAAIERAGFAFEKLEHFAMPRGYPLIKDAVQGTAVKRAA